MANLMRLTKQELIAKLTTSENLVKYQDEQIQDVNNRLNKVSEDYERDLNESIRLKKELIGHKESLKLRVNELTALVDVKNKGIKEQAEMIVELNNELSKSNKALESYKDSLFKATNAADDYICKLTIARNKNEYEKSLHKYYFAGGVLTCIVLYFLLTLLF